MTYNYYISASPINYESTSDSILNDFQAVINADFFNSPDSFVLLEEYPFASGSYISVDVRVNRAISTYTGTNQADDWKNLIFRDLQHATSLGVKYQFDSNTWIVINSEIIKNFAAGCTVRRANNMLRWMDANGIYREEPCILEYVMARPRDTMGSEAPVTPEGYTKIYCQLNSVTRKIKPNQRFLFGNSDNWTCLKIFGNGIRAFLNQQTSDNNSATLLEFQLGANFVNPDTDDLVNGIVDRYADFSNLSSGSSISPTIDIVVTPNVNYILESASALFDVHYYSGSTVLSGSFIFTVNDADVPTSHYAFGQESKNTFSVFNIQKYSNSTLDILCSGSSGSRLLSLELRGAW
jgi:hypothetical protein